MPGTATTRPSHSISDLKSLLDRLQNDRDLLSKNRTIRAALVGGRGEGKTSFYVALYLFAEELHPDYLLRFAERKTIGYLDPISKLLLSTGDIPANPATPPKTLHFSIIDRSTGKTAFEVECQDYSGHTIELLEQEEEHLKSIGGSVEEFNRTCDIALWLVDAADASLDDRNVFNMMFPDKAPHVALLLTKFDKFGRLPVSDAELQSTYERLKREHPDLFSIEATALSRRNGRPPAILPIAPLNGVSEKARKLKSDGHKRNDLKPWRMQAVIDELISAKSHSSSYKLARLDRDINELKSQLIHLENLAEAEAQKVLAAREKQHQAQLTAAGDRMRGLESEVEQATVFGVIYALMWSDHWKADARQIYEECARNGIEAMGSDWHRQMQRRIWTKQFQTGAIVVVTAMSCVALLLWIVMSNGSK
jgi:hypothetical protein